MRSLHFTFLVVILIAVIPVNAQTTVNKKENKMDFKKFRLDFAGMGMRFTGKKEKDVQGSKSGFGGFIQPTINLTNQHAVGLKLVWSYHAEDPKLNHFSVLANYMFTLYNEKIKPTSMEKFVTVISGVGIGITSGPGPKSNSVTHDYPTKISLAIMPYAGLRYGWLFGDIHYHIATGNKVNSFLGVSAGIMFNGGFTKRNR